MTEAHSSSWIRVAADALVIGAPSYFDMLGELAHCFLEQFYRFRHQEGHNSINA